MKRKQAGFQPITVFILLLLTTFLIIPQELILHQSKQSPEPAEAICCGECHPSSCCKLKRQVEFMNACCNIGFHQDIATSPQITVEEFVNGNLFHSIPPARLSIRHVTTFETFSPEVFVPPPEVCVAEQQKAISSN